MWKVEWSDNSITQLEKLDKLIAKRIISKINEIRHEPTVHVKKLVYHKQRLSRLRVGNYRVILELRYKSRTIFIVQINLRKNVYKSLRR